MTVLELFLLFADKSVLSLTLFLRVSSLLPFPPEPKSLFIFCVVSVFCSCPACEANTDAGIAETISINDKQIANNLFFITNPPYTLLFIDNKITFILHSNLFYIIIYLLSYLPVTYGIIFMYIIKNLFFTQNKKTGYTNYPVFL